MHQMYASVSVPGRSGLPSLRPKPFELERSWSIVSVGIAQFGFIQGVGQTRVQLLRKIELDRDKIVPVGRMKLGIPFARELIPRPEFDLIGAHPVLEAHAARVGEFGPAQRADGDEGKGAVHVGSNLPGFTPNALAIRISIVTVVSLCPVSRFVM